MDTVIWLLNFPVSHGFAVVVIAGFALLCLFARWSARSALGPLLPEPEERDELLSPRNGGGPAAAVRSIRVGLSALALLMLGSFLLGILGLTGVPVTRAYIYDHGQPTTATRDGDWVTFTTATGVEYTLESSIFSPAGYPDRDASFGEQVVVRYLPGHPQAFVIDSAQRPG